MIDKILKCLDKILPAWLRTSNRDKHILYAFPCGFIGGPLFVLGLALGMEYKDKLYGGEFDWLDIAATVIGGIPGSIFWALILFL